MKSKTPDCSIIIPVFNKWELTRNCLTTLHDYSAQHDFEIIVVDNASSDETASELTPLGKQLFGDRFTPIVFSENRNFGPACNEGARAATAPLLFFLNNDTLLTPEWAGPLLARMRSANAPGAVGPLLLYENNTVQHLGGALGSAGPLHLYQNFPVDHPVVSRSRRLQFLTGAALMTPADLFWDCGAFYEGYRNGFEDIELSVRMTQRGKALRCVPDSQIYHLESQSVGRKDFDAHNSALFTERCAKHVRIDLHSHAFRDGFAVFVNDLLRISLALKEEEVRSIAKQAEGTDIDAWLKLSKQNPLWVQGREILAQTFENAGEYAGAAALRAELATIEPRMERCRDLLRLAPYLPSAPWVASVEENLAAMLRYKTDYAKTLQSLRRRGLRSVLDADSFLEKIYVDKLREMFPQSTFFS